MFQNHSIHTCIFEHIDVLTLLYFISYIVNCNFFFFVFRFFRFFFIFFCFININS